MIIINKVYLIESCPRGRKIKNKEGDSEFIGMGIGTNHFNG